MFPCFRQGFSNCLPLNIASDLQIRLTRIARPDDVINKTSSPCIKGVGELGAVFFS